MGTNSFKLIDQETKTRRTAWYKYAFEDDLESACVLLEKHPRNSIILSYYSMYNRTLLYLVEVHSIILSNNINVHKTTVDELNEKLKDSVTKKRALELLNEAKKQFDSLKGIGVHEISGFLDNGRQERGRHSYYFEKYQKVHIADNKAAQKFIETKVKPYLKIFEELDV